MKKKISLIVIVFFCAAFSMQATAQESDTDETADAASHSLILQISTLPEAKLGYTFNYKFPFMQGDTPLTEGNNINLALSAEISPISLNGLASATWTPIAFLEFSAGGRIGTGWNIELFGGNIYGIGITQSSFANPSQREIVGTAFDGLLYKAQIGGAFQFDLAAIIPGDWNHVLFRTYHEINVAGYTRANGNESWVFENGDGENVNGFIYYGNVLLGYQMPIFLNMAAFLAEATINLYDIPNKSTWGGDQIQWHLSLILNFEVHKQIDITLITQLRTRKNYLESGWDKAYYRDLTINSSDPLRIEFYRVAAIVTYKF